MPDKPTFGRYSEIPYEQMTPEPQETYLSLIETRGRLLSPTDPEFAGQSRNDNRGHAERTVSSWSESPALLGSRRAERAGCGLGSGDAHLLIGDRQRRANRDH